MTSKSFDKFFSCNAHLRGRGDRGMGSGCGSYGSRPVIIPSHWLTFTGSGGRWVWPLRKDCRVKMCSCTEMSWGSPFLIFLMRSALASCCSARHSTRTSSTLGFLLRRAFISSSAASPSVFATPHGANVAHKTWIVPTQ